MIIEKDWISILNFRNRCVNQINLYDYDSTDIELVFYGRKKGLITFYLIECMHRVNNLNKLNLFSK